LGVFGVIVRIPHSDTPDSLRHLYNCKSSR
jgi:hypothetical protein